MKTRIRQFYHIGSDQVFRGQAAHSSVMARHSGPEAPKLKITHWPFKSQIKRPMIFSHLKIILGSKFQLLFDEEFLS